MRSLTMNKTVLVVGACAALALLAPGCKKPGSGGRGEKTGKGTALSSTAGGKGSARRAVAAPRSLIASFSVRNPRRTIDAGLALANRFVKLPFDRRGLLDLLLQRAHLHRDLLDALSLEGTFWLLRFDDKTVGQREPMVVVLPIHSAKRFRAALLARMEDKGKDGELTIYRPKPGQVGMTEARVFVGDGVAIVPSTRRVFDSAKDYIVGTLVAKRPAHDVELRIQMANLMHGAGKRLDRSLDTAMARLRQRAAGRPGKVDPKPAATALESTARRYYALLKSAREIILSADLGKDDITLRLAARAAAGGKLATLIKRQQPGTPFAQGLLPRTAWAVFANRGPSLVENANASPFDVALGSIVGAMSSPHREQFQTAVLNARKHFEDDVTLGIYRPPSGVGVTLALLGRVGNAEAASKSSAEVGKVLSAWFEAEAKKAGKSAGGALAPTSKDFSSGRAKGRVYQFTLPAEKPAQRARLDAFFGKRLTVGWLFQGSLAALVLGKDAEAQMRVIAEKSASMGSKQGAEARVENSLADYPPFRAALAGGGGLERVGLLYLSPVDFVRGLKGLGFAPAAPLIADLEHKTVERAPTLSWGVDRKRTTFALELALPAKHFLHFKGFLQALRQERPALPLP